MGELSPMCEARFCILPVVERLQQLLHSCSSIVLGELVPQKNRLQRVRFWKEVQMR